MEKLLAYFNGRNTFKVVVIELIVIGLLLCALLAMSVEVNVRLNGSGVVTLEVGDTFEDLGATAKADGHELKVKVSGKVDTAVPGTYTLHYKARYLLSTGDTTRTVKVVERATPSIQLTGGKNISITVGTTYEEPGYTATDVDGTDLTDKVKVKGTVDAMTAGDYELVYTVKGESGKTARITRTVKVKAAAQPEISRPEGKVIYLTFDDGPGKYTRQLLEVLAKYDAKATFFAVNTGYSKQTEMLKAIADGGHGIGIHSMTHDWSIYNSEKAFLDDLYAMQQVIKNATGVTTTLMRFPGGSSNTVSKDHCQGIMTVLTQKVTELGFQYFDWDVDSNDAGGAKTAEQVYQNVIKGIGNRKTAVILQHDIKEYSVEAVEKILKWGSENGYRFEALTPSSPACHHPVNN